LNINDGFGGGNLITGNLLFNTGRAANKDEGSINTWDRVPYITEFRNGTASTIPAWNNISNNFLIGNYNPSLAIDNDDGSSFYEQKQNFVVYGQAGFKADFGAHDMRSVGNYYAYVDVAWAGFPASDGWFLNNSVILNGGSGSMFGSGYASGCGLIGRPGVGVIRGNAVYSKEHATMRVACLNSTTKACSVSCLLTEWLAEGHDPGTTVNPIPADDEVMEAARKLLGM
jgi:hypothetical protein